ncbi:MAG: acetolactate synthase small subunit [Alphaproteobacteria bacterium]|nr:acetolactate synthase small subunit [Alphaproteobacteria bacterium]
MIKKSLQDKHSVYGAAPAADPVLSHTLTVIVDNEPGILARVVGLFSGRGYNIESLTVAETDHSSRQSRMTIVCSGTRHVIEQIYHQLGRLIPVHQVINLSVEGPHVARELGLIKVAAVKEQRIEALQIADSFRAKTVDTTLESFVFELTGSPDKIDAFIDLMRPLGLVEVSRTGVAAILRGKKSV